VVQVLLALTIVSTVAAVISALAAVWAPRYNDGPSLKLS
jgi:hypothetical protein